MKLLRLMKRLRACERGISAMEYAMLLSVITMAIVGAVALLGSQFRSALNATNNGFTSNSN